MNPPPPYAVFPPPQPPLPPPPPPPPPFSFPPPLPPYSAVSSASLPSPIPTSSAASDLPTALSSLTSLLQLTQSSLSSISSQLPLPSPKAPPLARCPFNPNHLIPPPSLFSHHLSCPSSSTPLDAEPLLSSLHYPKALHSTPFTQQLEKPNSSEVCFSLEDFSTFPENFFYSNCPGPVTISPCSDDPSFTHPVLTLPAVLSAECANFSHSDGDMEEKGLNLGSMRLFPSENWAVRCEISGWNQYPVSYSCRLLKLIFRLRMGSLLHLEEWILVNSPFYGVVIDSALRDHIILLFKLSLKAVVTESITLGKLFIRDSESRYDKKFDCPNLVEAMSWFGCQLSILYGGVNGKTFSINILKQCMLGSALNSSIILMGEKDKDSAIKLDALIGNTVDMERKTTADELVTKSSVYVSQVASAVAALYERSWLELRIKALRNPQPLSAYQRKTEHEHISRRANDERQQRPDYRPVIDHDGFLWQHMDNQDPNKTKTREELLAEERDYKRRRMSYRGKKMKRSTTQVMRDIIDEYMEEIKKVNGILQGADKVEPRGSESCSVPGDHVSTMSLERDKAVDLVSRSQHHDYGGKLPYHSNQSLDPKANALEDNVQRTGDSRKHQRDLENDRSVKRARYDRDYSRSPHRQSDSHVQNHSRSRWKHSDPEISRERFSQSLDRSHSKSDRHKSHRKEENEFHLDSRSSRSRRRHQDHNSSSSRAEFEDRYNPTGIDDGG